MSYFGEKTASYIHGLFPDLLNAAENQGNLCLVML